MGQAPGAPGWGQRQHLIAAAHPLPRKPAWAQQSQAVAELKRPVYQIRRFDEDWSELRGVDLLLRPAADRA